MPSHAPTPDLHSTALTRWLRPALSIALLLMVLPTVTSSAQQAQASDAKPIITTIDPPDWWVQMPDPMLLIHGEHLGDAHFRVSGDEQVTIDRIQNSANGHWAFLTLHTANARPQTLHIVAEDAAGSTTSPYELKARRPASEQPKGFSSSDVMYLIMPDRFADGDPANDHIANFPDPDDRTLARAYHGGDLRGIEQHLDYLQRLGITTVWTTPLYDNTANQSRSTYHGYSATSLYAVDPHLGTMADYQHMVAAAHSRGMKVVLDTVPNHVGPGNPWLLDPPTPTWFHGSRTDHVAVLDDYTSVTDPHATPARRHVFLDGWFADILPDLNQNDPLVAKYLIQNSIWWIESAGLDGLRIDTFAYVPRTFWHQFHAQLHSLYPALTTVGEIFNRDPTIPSFFAGGIAHTGSDGTVDTGLDTPFDFPLYFALRDTLIRHAPMTKLTDVLRQDSLYPHPERLVTFLGNHDTARFLSEPGANEQALQLGFGLLATLRGMPQLYSGDEIAMTGGDDPENRHDFPGGFPGDPSSAFTSQGRTPQQQQTYSTVAALLQLRKQSPALQSGAEQDLLSDDTAFAFLRGRSLQGGCRNDQADDPLRDAPLHADQPLDDRLLIIANNSAAARDVVLPTAGTDLNHCTTFTPAIEAESTPQLKDGRLSIHLNAMAIAVYRAQ